MTPRAVGVHIDPGAFTFLAVCDYCPQLRYLGLSRGEAATAAARHMSVHAGTPAAAGIRRTAYNLTRYAHKSA